MNESLSDFLGRLELRGQCWCYVDMRAASGFSVPPNNAVLFYAVLQGSARIAGIAGQTIELQAGEVAIILSGEAHAVRNQAEGSASLLEFLREGRNVDVPPTIALGRSGRVETRILAGRLEPAWSRDLGRNSIPSMMRLDAEAIGAALPFMRKDALQFAGVGNGAGAMLTRLASLLLVSSLRHHSQYLLLVQAPAKDPIAEALRLIASDPAAGWSVEQLARSVGMGRSNFAARFTAEVGRAPMEVITDQRMQYAAKLLAQGDLKISEISARVGYTSEGAFSRRFTRHFGLTPSCVRGNSENGASEIESNRSWLMVPRRERSAEPAENLRSPRLRPFRIRSSATNLA